uniref:Cytochrome P450, family 1, subfamily C, polypeptide 2 n=1 Tax=Sphaeramia orbicularis TaxID=375764 RepID=A0A673C8P6_9TELE
MGQEPQTQEKTAWTLRLACGGQRHAAGSNASHHLAKLAKKYGNVYQIRLGHLPYLDAFIYETMRFTNVTIEGQFIPKDTVVFINQWSINHDPLSERTPYLNPSRFLDENGSLDKDITNSVMIFSAGKRRCIGDQIAKVEIFLFFAILLHQCTFEKCPTQDLSLDCSYGLTLKPLDYKISCELHLNSAVTALSVTEKT